MYNLARTCVKSRFPRSGAPIALVDGFLHDSACVEKRGGTTGASNQRAGDRRGKRERERCPVTNEKRNTGTRPDDTEDAYGHRDEETRKYVY